MTEKYVRVYVKRTAHLRHHGNWAQYGPALCGRTPLWYDPFGWRGYGPPLGPRAEIEQAAKRPLCKQCEKKAGS